MEKVKEKMSSLFIKDPCVGSYVFIHLYFSILISKLYLFTQFFKEPQNFWWFIKKVLVPPFETTLFCVEQISKQWRLNMLQPRVHLKLLCWSLEKTQMQK